MQCFHGYSKPLTAGVPDLCTDTISIAGAEIGLPEMFYSTIKYTMCCLATFCCSKLVSPRCLLLGETIKNGTENPDLF